MNLVAAAMVAIAAKNPLDIHSPRAPSSRAQSNGADYCLLNCYADPLGDVFFDANAAPYLMLANPAP